MHCSTPHPCRKDVMERNVFDPKTHVHGVRDCVLFSFVAAHPMPRAYLVDIIMTPKDVHVLITRTHGYVTLIG